MNNEELKYLVEYSLQEHKAILDIVQNKSTPVTRDISGYKTGFEKKIDKAFHNFLRAALTSDDTDYLTNPQKSCLRTAISFVLAADPTQLMDLQVDRKALVLDDNSRELLSLLARQLKECTYTDTELFGDITTDDEKQLYLLNLIDNTLAAVPLLDAAFLRVRALYVPALQESQRLKRFVSTEIEQEDEASAGEIAELNGIIEALQECLAGSRQSVYMQTLTFPNDVATCTCGNCNAINSAANILRAKSYSAQPKEYRDANVYARQAILSHAVSGSITTAQLAARMGYVTPVVCRKCGAVNLTSGLFMTLYKEAVQTKWINCQPAVKNNDALCIYSAAIVREVKTKYLDSSTTEQKQIFNEMLPDIQHQEEEVKELSVELTDLFSAETYSSYLAELNTDIGSSVLYDTATRQDCLLRYLIAELHYTTIGSRPVDMIHTLLVLPQFKEEQQRLKSLTGIIAAMQQDIAVLTAIKRILESDLMGMPLAGYQDQVLSGTLLLELMNQLEYVSHNAQEIPALTEIQEMLNSVESELSDKMQEVHNIATNMHNKLVKMEAQACDQPDVTDILLLDLHDVSETAIWLSPVTEEDNIYVETGIADCIWSAVSDCYHALLIQTLFTKLGAIRDSNVFFNGVLCRNNSIANSKKLISKLLGVRQASIKIVDETDAAKQLILASYNCDSMSDLTTFMGITEDMLLKYQMTELPAFADVNIVKYYNLINTLGYGKLELFNSGYNIEQYGNAVLFATTEDTEETIGAGEANALAEVAATMFCILMPDSQQVPLLKEELKEYQHARTGSI